MLRPGGQHEGQPMGRDGGVEKRNRKPGNGDGGENGVVHGSQDKPEFRLGSVGLVLSRLIHSTDGLWICWGEKRRAGGI